ncbi:MAG: Rid family detoxifying hydrolase [Gemmatimonadota bacterium]|nr:Rid family detoxifying hydrolase [Gemmatimonadota bacterium]MDE3127220.1 Rid family detoxifying hydrolase [Gemmatimonadota bacterium]MDE3174056.1 Rid family detoxifying hydrolase [Gemmatimonadota bacterium]MDE3217560.1 Rid family detoxifying hydrolase [Gemmatimonadota bacterium]
MHPIATPAAPTPAGHYSQGIAHAGLVYVAGQLPLDPATGEVVGAGDIAAQTERVLLNVEAVLRAANSGLDRLLSVTVFVTGRDLWGGVNAVYARMLGAHRPARAIVPVGELKPGCLIEVQAVAAQRE